MVRNWLAESFRSNRRSRKSPWRARFERLESREVPASFTPGNLVIYRIGSGETLANTGNQIFLDEYTTAGALVQSIPMPSGTPGASLIASGSATSEGALTLSPDGKYLAFTGYNRALPNATPLAGSPASTINRAVGLVNSEGVLDLTSLSDAYDGNNIRGAVTTDGNTIYTSGTAGGGLGGVRLVTRGESDSTLLSTSVTNIRTVNVFDGQLYGSSQSGSYRVYSVGTGMPDAPSQVAVNLPGFPTSGGSPYAFYFADLDVGVPGVDTLYVADDGATTPTLGAGIQKFSLVGGSWTFNNSVPITNNGIRSLTGSVNAGVVTLYATNFDSKSVSNLLSLNDADGYNQNMTGSLTTLVTAGSKIAFRGVAFAPTVATSTLSSLTAPGVPVTGNSVTYTAVFSNAISGLTAANFSLTTTGDAAGVIGTPTTSDNITWTIPITSVVGDGMLRLNLANATGITPALAFVPFSQGTIVTVDHAPVVNTLDFDGGLVSYAGAKVTNNDVTLSLSTGVYTLSDNLGVITLTQNAKNAGWTGDGTNIVTGPANTVTGFDVHLSAGVDAFTLDSTAHAVTISGGGDVGDTLNIPNNVTIAGALTATGFDGLNVTFGVLLAVDQLTLGASAIGSPGLPILTTSTSVVASASAGGIYIQETDGASFTLNVAGSNDIDVQNSAGILTIGGKSWGGTGNVALTSADGIGFAADFISKGNIVLTAFNGAVNQSDGVIQTSGTLSLAALAGVSSVFASVGNKAGLFDIQSGTAIVDGSFAASGAVQVADKLGGGGSVGTTTVLSGATVAPGSSPGKLSVGNTALNFGSIFDVELDGSTPGAGGYDQLNVVGTIDLGGATLQATLGYVPVINQVLTIVDNDGADAVQNTFFGLSEGDTITLGAYNFKLSYQGGTGNDVTLTSLDGKAANPPTASVTVENGMQRSVIKTITVTFYEPVTFPNGAAAAFQLQRLNTSQSPGPIGFVTLAAPQISGAIVTLTFADTVFAPNAQGGSLIDGQYRLTIVAANVTGPGGQLNGGVDEVSNFARLYGDSDGNGVVDLSDFGLFRAAFTPNYNSIFDYDGNGVIDLTDFGQFRSHFQPFAP